MDGGAFSGLSFFEDNLETLALPLSTRRDVRDATPKGRIVLDSDRTPVIDVDGRLLGSPLPDEQLEHYYARSSPKTAFVVFGLGAGHVARALRSRTSSPVLVYEPDAGVLRSVLENGPTDLGGIHVVTDLHDLMSTWVKMGIDRLEGIVVRTPGYCEAYPDALLQLTAAVHDVFQRIGITRNTYHSRARTWVMDVLENLPTIVGTVPFVSLIHRFKDVPAFIVGAGPSLDKNVALLGEAAKKGIVFAVNSSSRALAKASIEPHVLACIESIDSAHLLAELPYIDRVVRAISLCAAPNILRTGKGPLLPIHESLPQLAAPLEELTGVPGVAVCGSVSTAAFSLAEALGCNPIVFVGQDLAYTSGRTHAGGTWWEDSRATASKEDGQVDFAWSESLKKIGFRHHQEPMSEVTAWGGEGTAMSGASFTGIRLWLESVAELIHQAAPHMRLVNATEGGARIDGFEEMRLRNLLDELPELGITPESIAEMARGARAPLNAADLKTWAERQSERAARVRREARRLRRIATHAKGAIRGNDARSVSTAFAALDEAERALKAAVAAAPIVDLWAHDVVRAASDAQETDAPAESAQAEAARSTERGIRIAEAIESAARELQRHFDTTARGLAGNKIADPVS